MTTQHQEQLSHESDCHHDSGHGYLDHKDEYLRRLRRIEGQARGLQRMVDEEQYCIDILAGLGHDQALEGLASQYSTSTSHCVVRAARAGGAEADEKLAEASAAIARLVRS